MRLQIPRTAVGRPPLGLPGERRQALFEPVDRDALGLAPGIGTTLRLQPLATGDFTLRTIAQDRGSVGMMGRRRGKQLCRDHPGQDGAAAGRWLVGPDRILVVLPNGHDWPVLTVLYRRLQ